MKRLVVNADDFGMADSINQGILEAHQRGIVTSTTLLANGAAFEEAVAIAKATPKLGVGVHLNLTQGRPVSDPASVTSLVDEEGEFARPPAALLRAVLAGSVRLGEVEREFAAQIEKVRDAGIAITHLDGHKHVHMLPRIFRIVVRLAKSYGITGVRWASEGRTGLWALLRWNRPAAATIVKQNAQSRSLALLAAGTRASLREAGLRSPTHFFGITQTGFLDDNVLSVILHNLPDGTSELMCHPGCADPALDATLTRLRAERQRELDALTHPETLHTVSRMGVELIDYRGLSQA